MNYPQHHKQIVEDLMDGRFILSKEKHFQDLSNNADEFYTPFFDKSFGYKLVVTQDYAYLLSHDTDETTSRDISIFFALFCYELDKQGKNFIDGLQYAEYSLEEVNHLFDNSSYIDLIETNKQLKDPEARRKLIFTTMNKRNIVEKVSDDKFYFTPAYKLFIEFAKELAVSESPEVNPSEGSSND